MQVLVVMNINDCLLLEPFCSAINYDLCHKITNILKKLSLHDPQNINSQYKRRYLREHTTRRSHPVPLM